MQKQTPSKASCKDIEEDLVLYLYGESAGIDQKSLEGHLADCAPCRKFLKELRAIVPLTLKSDEPSEKFWSLYSREMHQKLAAAEQHSGWRGNFISFFRLWPVPALAAAVVVILVVALSFTEGIWRSREPAPEPQTPVQTQLAANNLEFFKNMDLLDSMELLEQIGGKDNAYKDSRNGV